MRRHLFVLALILWPGICAALAPPQEPPPKRVLLISTGSRLAPGFVLVDQQILKALGAVSGARIDIYAENLDILRFPADRSRRIFSEYLSAKYVEHPPDLVVLVFVGKLGVTANTLEHLFPNTPIIIAGSTEEEFTSDQFGPNVGGFAQRVNPHATLELMLRLQPDLRRIAVVGGTAD